VRQSDDKLLGNCGLFAHNTVDQRAELGIFIGDKENHGKGYGAEALRLLLDYSFNVININSVILGVYEFNTKAQRCYEKVGFKVIGRRRKAIYKNGGFCDLFLMDILKDEFNAKR